jgi:hypothetical protein
LFAAKCTEVYGEKYGGIVLGTIALGNIPLSLTIGLVSEVILGQDLRVQYYLTYFLIVSSGPAIALLSGLLFPTSEKDKIQSKKTSY